MPGGSPLRPLPGSACALHLVWLPQMLWQGKEASFITSQGMKPTENSGSTIPGPILLARKATGGVWLCAGGGERQSTGWSGNFLAVGRLGSWVGRDRGGLAMEGRPSSAGGLLIPCCVSWGMAADPETQPPARKVELITPVLRFTGRCSDWLPVPLLSKGLVDVGLLFFSCPIFIIDTC